MEFSQPGNETSGSGTYDSSARARQLGTRPRRFTSVCYDREDLNGRGERKAGLEAAIGCTSVGRDGAQSTMSRRSARLGDAESVTRIPQQLRQARAQLQERWSHAGAHGPLVYAMQPAFRLEKEPPQRNESHFRCGHTVAQQAHERPSAASADSPKIKLVWSRCLYHVCRLLRAWPMGARRRLFEVCHGVKKNRGCARRSASQCVPYGTTSRPLLLYHCDSRGQVTVANVPPPHPPPRGPVPPAAPWAADPRMPPRCPLELVEPGPWGAPPPALRIENQGPSWAPARAGRRLIAVIFERRLGGSRRKGELCDARNPA